MQHLRAVMWSLRWASCGYHVAIKWVVLTFYFYLLGHIFTLCSDNAPLQWLHYMKDAKVQLTYWHLGFSLLILGWSTDWVHQWLWWISFPTKGCQLKARWLPDELGSRDVWHWRCWRVLPAGRERQLQHLGNTYCNTLHLWFIMQMHVSSLCRREHHVQMIHWPKMRASMHVQMCWKSLLFTAWAKINRTRLTKGIFIPSLFKHSKTCLTVML